MEQYESYLVLFFPLTMNLTLLLNCLSCSIILHASMSLSLPPFFFSKLSFISDGIHAWSQVPICASTGGLVDTVKGGYTGFHMGAFSVEVCKSSYLPLGYVLSFVP